ncbi:hypothetical protein FF38_06107 [Lucilia cuprina]|uniref:Uncharacterized protein n=1 Tax=Lucilia cuprina TaxID=7375 RepID=A0A0L0CEU9_LUCCU|nr:hypothetical protein FF38_06107 [Lucilia cuprina]
MYSLETNLDLSKEAFQHNHEEFFQVLFGFPGVSKRGPKLRAKFIETKLLGCGGSGKVGWVSLALEVFSIDSSIEIIQKCLKISISVIVLGGSAPLVHPQHSQKNQALPQPYQTPRHSSTSDNQASDAYHQHHSTRTHYPYKMARTTPQAEKRMPHPR